MGKAHKRLKNQLKKQGKLEKKQKPHQGPCFIEGCKGRGGEIFHCRTCEALVAAGKKKEDDVFRLQVCTQHRDEALWLMKRHALLAHPFNILRATGAALKGQL
jgi:hypothetical protein